MHGLAEKVKIEISHLNFHLGSSNLPNRATGCNRYYFSLASESPTPIKNSKIYSKEEDITLIYELRTYWAAPGKTEALLERFRSLTLALFEQHNMQVVGFWTPQESGDENGDLIYLLKFENQEAKEQAWNAFRQDKDWVEGKAASETDGVLTSRLTSIVLTPTDFSLMQ